MINPESLKTDLLALRSLVSEDDFIWRGTTQENNDWQDALNDDINDDSFAKYPPPSISLDVEPIQLLISFQAWDKKITTPLISIRSDKLSRLATDNIVAESNLYLDQLNSSEDYNEGGLLVELLGFVQGKLDEVVSGQDAISDQDKEKETETSQANSKLVKQEIVLKRVLFWSHHLMASSKRKDIVAWSSELDLWCISKPGYPGIIIIEGCQDESDEFVRRIKRLQWKALQVRSEEVHFVSNKSREWALSNACKLRLAVIGPQQEQKGHNDSIAKPESIESDSMSDVSNRMEFAGLKELFLSAAMKF